MTTYTTIYKVTTTTGNGAKCIHTFSNHKEARQLMSEQSYFAHEMETIIYTTLCASIISAFFSLSLAIYLGILVNVALNLKKKG